MFNVNYSNHKSNSNPEILIKISEEVGSKSPSVVSAFKSSGSLEEENGSLVIKAVFE